MRSNPLSNVDSRVFHTLFLKHVRVRGLSNIQFIENGFTGSGHSLISDVSRLEIGTSLPSAVDFACEQAIATTAFAYKMHSQDSGCPQRSRDRMYRQITNCLV